MSETDIIRKIPIFSDLEPEELKEVSNIYIQRKYKKGQIIFFEGDPGEAVYFVKEGKIKIYKSDPKAASTYSTYSDPAIFLQRQSSSVGIHILPMRKPLKTRWWEL